MQSIQAPPDKNELWALLGTLGAWKSHAPEFHILEKPLYNLLKKNTVWDWEQNHHETLSALNNEILLNSQWDPFTPHAPLDFKKAQVMRDEGYQWGL